MINYYLLTKPGIIMGNLITVAAGFALGSSQGFDLWLFVVTLLGLTGVIASACVLNNYIDREIDKKMTRTKSRPLVQGLISHRRAILFAIALGLLGFSLLFFYTNLLTTCVAAIGFCIYVFVYSLWKSRTIYATAIGSIAGAVPPVIGYCAASNHFDLGAILLFTLLVLWQMPHFFSIAVYHLEDYRAAHLPVYPVKKGMVKTKVRMIIYIIGFTAATLSLTLFHYTGYLYLIVGAVMSLLWLIFSLKGFTAKDDKAWGRKMFRISLLTITSLSILIPFDHL